MAKKNFFPKEPKQEKLKEAPDLGPSEKGIMIREVMGTNVNGQPIVFRMMVPEVAYKALQEIRADLKSHNDYEAVVNAIIFGVQIVRGVRRDRKERGLKPATSFEDWFQFYKTFFVGRAQEAEK